MLAEPVRIDLGENGTVSALLIAPARSVAAYILAHGAGAGMTHRFLVTTAEGLAERGVATLRYQFPYMEKGKRHPDTPRIASATVRAAVKTAMEHLPETPLIAGGKSFGGRMTSQAQAESPLPGVRGLVFFGFPLHPAGKPSIARADHLHRVELPMLFVQGSRDRLADAPLISGVVGELGGRASLVIVRDADHSFHLSAKSGRTDPQALDDILDATADWIRRVLEHAG